MAVRGFAITPKGILSGVHRIAPNVSIKIRWQLDRYYIWDGDGPDPVEQGYVPHNVYVSAVVVTTEGKTVFGRGVLGGVYESEGMEDPNIHGYFPQLLEIALMELHRVLIGKRITGGRKEWDPREARKGRRDRIVLATEVRVAAMFVQRSMEEIYNREQRRA